MPFKIKEYLDNYIHQEVYDQLQLLKVKKKYLLNQQLKIIFTQIILETCPKEDLMIILSMD